MKILVAVDMEGISGVANWDQVTPGHAEYVRFRKIMTGDVNAAVRGAFEAGADEVVVTDGHASGYNILIEELDPRARLNVGNSSPLSMVQGVDVGVNAAIFIGYHARAGAKNAILDHTWSSTRVANLWLNGQLTGETGLNAAVCGHFDVPLIMISGDQTVCGEARELFASIEVAIVKQASGRTSAYCFPLQVTQQKIFETATRAVKRLMDGQAPAPFRMQSPIQITIEFFNPDMADRASSLPGSRRLNGRRIEYTTEDMPAAYVTFQAAVALSKV